MKQVGDRIELLRGDITLCAVDAIVNAAKESLLGGGGVDGAIHRAAGPELLAECRTIGGCPTGQARITHGYRLPAAYVIHTVGPVYRDGRSGEAQLLASCYRESLELARRHDCRSVAFPAISCGVYAYPIAHAAEIAIRTLRDFLQDHSVPHKAICVVFSQGDYDAYAACLHDRGLSR